MESLANDLRGPNAGVEIAAVDCSNSLQVGGLVDRYAPDLEVIHYNAAIVRAQTLQEQSPRRLLKIISRLISPALWSLSGRRARRWCRGSILLTGGDSGREAGERSPHRQRRVRFAADTLFPDFGRGAELVEALACRAHLPSDSAEW